MSFDIDSLINEFIKNLSWNCLPFNSNYSSEIFHYTSIRNMPSILLDKPNKISLWASQFDCLNDMSEGTVVDGCYQSVCARLHEKSMLSNELYALFSDVKPSRNETFTVTENGKSKVYRGEYTTYIASFSKSNDLLPMWNYYSKGDMFEGINLGITVTDAILASFLADGKGSVSICPVIYSKSEQEQIMQDFLLELARKYSDKYKYMIRALISMKLTSLKMTFKKECFEHEQEVRIIVNIPNKYANILPVKYRATAGYIVPYIELEIDKKALTSITLGPFRGTDLQKKKQIEILHQMLVSNGYNVLENSTNIPVRY